MVTILSDPFLISSGIFLLVFGMFLLIAGLVKQWQRARVRRRLLRPAQPTMPMLELPGFSDLVRSTLPTIGAMLPPENETQRNQLQTRLMQSGLYGRQVMAIYLGVKGLLILAPWALGLALSMAGLVPMLYGLGAGGMLSVLGIILPGIWLDRVKARRQASCRQGLPDFLDILVICLEAGLSPGESLRRVLGDLGSTFPVLGMELQIVQREMELGGSAGAALRSFAERSALREVGNLALAVSQAERFGGGLAKAVRQQAETLRFQQYQNMEESIQKANTKILIPTLLLIFPGIFVILLGPAALQVSEMMSQMKAGTQKVQAKQ